MPRPIATLPDGYAVIRSAAGFYLLRERERMPGDIPLYEQIAGPYTQRINAVRMAERDAQRRKVSGGQMLNYKALAEQVNEENTALREQLEHGMAQHRELLSELELLRRENTALRAQLAATVESSTTNRP